MNFKNPLLLTHTVFGFLLDTFVSNVVNTFNRHYGLMELTDTQKGATDI